MNIPRPSILFHIGRPDTEEPHRSMDRCEKFHKENPDIKFVIVVWTEEDAKAMEEKRDKEHAEVLFWKDEETLLAYLFDRIGSLIGAQILGPRWYICTEKHITKCTDKFLLEKCEQCGNAMAFLNPNEEKIKEFVATFGKLAKLTNFDTTSGLWLNQMVNPMQNLMLNMPSALGCEHAKPLECRDLKDSGKGKTALVVGAGPSLKHAIPHLKRLQETCIIICVGRVFKPLKAAGVNPHYTISVEMFGWDCEIFKGLSKEDCGSTVMAYASVCAPDTVKAWPGKKTCLWDIETAKMMKRDDAILGGNSVAHHMLNFAAQILGCDPIVLVGIDLGYTEPKTHIDGSTPETWPDEIKKKEVEYQAELWVPCTGKGGDFDPECHRTPVFAGQGSFLPSRVIEVRSSPAYENFATLFTILIKKHGKRVLNACGNGQKILGTEYVDLSTM